MFDGKVDFFGLVCGPEGFRERLHQICQMPAWRKRGVGWVVLGVWGGGVLSNLIELQDSDRWVFSPRLLVCQTLGHTQLTRLGGEVDTERRWGQKRAEGTGGGGGVSQEVPHSLPRIGGQQK